MLAGFAVFSGLALGMSDGAAAAESAPKARKNPMLDENRRHDLSVFSFMNDLGNRRDQAPVLVTLKVKGPKALTSFCEFLPKVNEAVLSVMMQGPPVRGDEKKILAAIEAPLKKAVNDVLPGHPVRRVVTRSAMSVSEFGPDLLKTKNACKAIDG